MEKCLYRGYSNIIGITMNTNPFYHHKKISKSLGTIPAGFYMFQKHYNNTIENDAIEDMERTLEYFKNYKQQYKSYIYLSKILPT